MDGSAKHPLRGVSPRLSILGLMSLLTLEGT